MGQEEKLLGKTQGEWRKEEPSLKEDEKKEPSGPCTSAPLMLFPSHVGTAAFRAGVWPRHQLPGGTHHLGGAGRGHQRGG